MLRGAAQSAVGRAANGAGSGACPTHAIGASKARRLREPLPERVNERRVVRHARPHFVGQVVHATTTHCRRRGAATFEPGTWRVTFSASWARALASIAAGLEGTLTFSPRPVRAAGAVAADPVADAAPAPRANPGGARGQVFAREHRARLFRQRAKAGGPVRARRDAPPRRGHRVHAPLHRCGSPDPPPSQVSSDATAQQILLQGTGEEDGERKGSERGPRSRGEARPAVHDNASDAASDSGEENDEDDGDAGEVTVFSGEGARGAGAAPASGGAGAASSEQQACDACAVRPPPLAASHPAGRSRAELNRALRRRLGIKATGADVPHLMTDFASLRTLTRSEAEQQAARVLLANVEASCARRAAPQCPRPPHPHPSSLA